MDRNEIEELIEWHEAEVVRLEYRAIPNVNLDKHRRAADALRHLLQAQTFSTSLIESLIRRDSRISDEALETISREPEDAEYVSFIDPNSALAILSARHLLRQHRGQFEERASATPSEQQGTNDHDTEN